MENQTTFPEPVRVELRCGGQSILQTHSDTQGNFSLELPPRRNPDSIDGLANPANCDLQGVLPGFQSSRVLLGHRSAFDRSFVATIVLRRLEGVEGTSVSLNTLKAPEDAQRVYNNARKELSKTPPRYDRALRDLQKALAIYPEFAAAWQRLGEIKAAQNDLTAAREAFVKAKDIDSKYITPYLALANLELKSGEWGKCAALAVEVLRLNPYVPTAQYLTAYSNYQLGNFQAAESAARKVEESSDARRYPSVFFILGSLLARKGDYPGAAERLRMFLKLAPKSDFTAAVQKQLSDWEQKGLI